jgi:hypothetical protein
MDIWGNFVVSEETSSFLRGLLDRVSESVGENITC